MQLCTKSSNWCLRKWQSRLAVCWSDLRELKIYRVWTDGAAVKSMGAFPEDRGLILSTHMAAHFCNSSSKKCDTHFWPLLVLHIQSAQIMHARQNTYKHKNNLKYLKQEKNTDVAMDPGTIQMEFVNSIDEKSCKVDVLFSGKWTNIGFL